MDHEIIEAPPAVPARTRSEDEIMADVQLIKRVMERVFQRGAHYDTVPGCGPKPTLLKAGAEKIASTFRLAIEPIVEDLSTDDEIRYRVQARATHMATGQFVGAGIGECSTNEEKYRWRKAVSEDEYAATPEDRRRGKFTKRGTIPQVRTSPADAANTVLKMAKKRALVDCVLTVTAASDCFTQDLEESAGARVAARSDAEAARPPTAPPQRTAPPPPSSDGRQEVVGVIEDITSKSGENDRGPWTRWGITIGGAIYGTFSESDARIAEECEAGEVPVVCVWEQRGKYRNIVSLEPAPATGAHADQTDFDL